MKTFEKYKFNNMWFWWMHSHDHVFYRGSVYGGEKMAERFFCFYATNHKIKDLPIHYL